MTAFEALLAAAEEMQAASQALAAAIDVAKAKLARIAELKDLSAEGFFEGAVLDFHEAGLTATESLMVSTIRKGRGRVVSYDALASLSSRDLVNGGPDKKVVSVRLCNIRRKRADLGAHLKVVHGQGVCWAA